MEKVTVLINPEHSAYPDVLRFTNKHPDYVEVYNDNNPLGQGNNLLALSPQAPYSPIGIWRRKKDVYSVEDHIGGTQYLNDSQKVRVLEQKKIMTASVLTVLATMISLANAPHATEEMGEVVRQLTANG